MVIPAAAGMTLITAGAALVSAAASALVRACGRRACCSCLSGGTFGSTDGLSICTIFMIRQFFFCLVFLTALRTGTAVFRNDGTCTQLLLFVIRRRLL